MISGWIVGKDELIARFSAMLGKLDECLLKTMTGLALELAGYISANYLSGQEVKAVTGTGRRSTRSLGVERIGDSITATVRTGGPEAPYMKWLNDGLPAYDIVPKNKKALAFQWQGKSMVLRRVHHPGQKAREFMQAGLAAFAPTIKGRLEDAVKEAVKQ
jgi:hypothetical protein